MVRKDVHQSVNTAEDDGKVTEARASRQEQISDYDQLNPYLRFSWQYGGLLLGTVAIIGLLWPVLRYDPDYDPHPFHNIGWTLVILVAFGIHSTRPYQNSDTVSFDQTKPGFGGSGSKEE